jgi:hypothetical protein
MKNRFDRMAKNVYAEALAPIADVKPGLETSPDAQVIDLWCEARGEPIEELGLLGQMARGPCLLEPFSGTVTLDEVRRCARKQDGRYRELQNENARVWKAPPRLWILSTGFPCAAMHLGFEPSRAWPRGLYQLPDPWRVYLVVRSELRRERATLLLRITGTGRVLREAVEDLKREPESSRMRRVLARELARLHLELSGDAGSLTPEEEEFAMTGAEMLRDVELRAEQRGEELGRQEGARCMVRLVRLAFERRFGPMPASLESALGKATSLDELEKVTSACLTGSREEVEQMLGTRVH